MLSCDHKGSENTQVSLVDQMMQPPYRHNASISEREQGKTAFLSFNPAKDQSKHKPVIFHLDLSCNKMQKRNNYPMRGLSVPLP